MSLKPTEIIMMKQYSIEDHKALIAEIQSTEDLLKTLKNNLSELTQAELLRVSEIFKNQFGLDISNFIKKVGVKSEYINIGYLYDYLGTDWEAISKKLEELDLINFHYVFYSSDNETDECEISKEEFLECSTPNEKGMFMHPLLGEECSELVFNSQHYRFVSTTKAYSDFINQNTELFGL